MAANPLAYALAFGAALMWPTYSVLACMFGGGFRPAHATLDTSLFSLVFLTLTTVLLWAQWLVLETAPMPWSWGVVAQMLAIDALNGLGYGC